MPVPFPQGSLTEKERQTAEPASSSRSARDHLDDRFDQRNGVRSRRASIHPVHSFGRKGDQAANDQPPVRRRIFRNLARFVVTLLIGVGGTLAWQSYGDVAREVVVTQAPALGWLVSALPARSPAVAASSNPAQQAGFSSLDALRRSVEQLAARQEQMAQNMAALRAVGEDIRQKMSFTPPSVPAAVIQPAASVPPRRPVPRAGP